MLYFYGDFSLNLMIVFRGEYDCKIDAKGRFMLPVAFRRQLGEVDVYRFIIKKDMYEKYLELYTIEAWEHDYNRIANTINPYKLEHRQLLRGFSEGATEVECDPTGRLLIPGRLLKQAEITNEALLAGSKGKIEIWLPKLYYESIGDAETKRERFERIMGDFTYNTQLS